MYITRVPNRKSRPAILLRESYREGGKVCTRTIANLTNWSPEQLAAMERLVKDEFGDCSGEETSGEIFGVLFALKHLADQVGITRVLGTAAESKLNLFLILARIAHGGSRLSAVRWAQQHAVSRVLALAAQDYGARFFANDAKPTGGWIEFPGSFKDSEAKKVFRESYQAAQSGENRGKVLVLENGMKFHEVGVTNRDAQFLELRKFQITDIARLFRVPPHMIADLDRATFSNIEQQSLEFVMHTMTPWAERWEASIEAELLFDGDDLEVEFDFANLMRGDAASRSSYYQSGIQNGWLTRNEARIAENLNPLDGLDEPLRPLNLVEEGSAGNLAGNTEQSKPPAQDAAEPMDE